MRIEFCPKCGNPIRTDVDPARLCGVCAWFGDTKETANNAPLTDNLDTCVRQAIAYYRLACRAELILEAAYREGELSFRQLAQAQAQISKTEASLLDLFRGTTRAVIPRLSNGCVPWPGGWPRRANPVTECDMLVGPCACGAWHSEDEEWVQQLLLEHNARIA